MMTRRRKLSMHYVDGRGLMSLCRSCVKEIRDSGKHVSDSFGKNAEVKDKCDNCGKANAPAAKQQGAKAVFVHDKEQLRRSHTP